MSQNDSIWGRYLFGMNWSNNPIQRNREKLSNQREIYKRKEKPNTRKELQNQNFNNAKGIHQERKNQNDWKNLQISITNSTVIIWKCYSTSTPHLSITLELYSCLKTFTFLWDLSVRSTPESYFPTWTDISLMPQRGFIYLSSLGNLIRWKHDVENISFIIVELYSLMKKNIHTPSITLYQRKGTVRFTWSMHTQISKVNEET